MPYLSDVDREDILFGIKMGYDYIAASFVRTKEDVEQIRKLIQDHGSKMRIISKIENTQGLENLDEILEASDGIMVARGDMGVEVAMEEVPVFQKRMIKKALVQGKLVITATQMLDSMMHNPRPTRAEVTDVANAIYDGTDAIMLSGETANGKYPVEALKMMVEIAVSTEEHLNTERFLADRRMYQKQNVSSAVGAAAVLTADHLQADAIATPTVSGQTARLISSFRPKVPILAVTPNETVLHKLQLYWGVIPLKGNEKDSTEHIIEAAVNVIKKNALANKGDLLVFTAGDPVTNNRTGEGAVTNMMHVVEVK